MRIELELIEKIERYLKDQLSEAEKKAFEEQVAKDPVLQEEVALQREIIKGIERAALRQRVQKAGIRYKQGRNFLKWGSASLGIILITLAVLYYREGSAHRSSYADTGLPENNESGGKNWADADRNLEAQVFILDASSDTVIETKGGMILSVPANGFLDKEGQPVKGSIELTVKEALDPTTILKAGLSSRSGDRLLESAGMFFVDARKNGQSLKIDSSAGIYAQIPTDTIKPGMQLFNGKRMADGTIDWVNPTPLEHNLIPVDIFTLDFYPPHYLDSVGKWGYNRGDKVYTDSLYYSFAIVGEAEGGTPLTDTSSACGINPGKIKTIWSKAFQNTLLSTREFEQRLSQIHLIGDNRILDLYVSNLDKDLSTIDSMAAMQLHGAARDQFLSFAARHDGKVKMGTRHLRKLREYYEKKTTAWTRAIAKTQNEFWARQMELDNLSATKHMEHRQDSLNRYAQNIREEFDLNLKDAWRQLGYDTTVRFRPLNKIVYSLSITNTGWCNVDRFVYESVVNRTTLNFADSLTGKKAVIQYLPVSFQVRRSSEYDRLYVYLLPDKLSSFMRLTGTDGKYSDKLDELMRYNLICIAYKGEQAFFYSQDTIHADNYPAIELTKIGNNELKHELNKKGSRTQAADLKKEDEFFRFEWRDEKRQKRNEALEELRRKVELFLFPCYASVPASESSAR